MEKKDPEKLSHMTDEDMVAFLENIVDDENYISDENELLSQPESAKRGRPTSFTPPIKAKRTYISNNDIRNHQIGHWCTVLDGTGIKMRKMPGCKSETQCFCEKCKVNLCNSVTKLFFLNFHGPYSIQVPVFQ